MDEIPKASGVDRHAFSLQRHFRRLRCWEWAALVLVPVLATLALAYLHLTSPPPCISRSSFERIAVGMTERDVHRIIRARPGGYGWFVNEGGLLVQEWGSAECWACWCDSNGILEVGYDAEGRVCSKRLEYHPDMASARPDLWPWWRRLLDRSAPVAGSKRFYTHF